MPTSGLGYMRDGWMRLLNPHLREHLGGITHALFDFDGTLSLLRQGWEGIMIPMMLRCICGDESAPPEVEMAVHDFVDRSTGQLTIKQMQWLAEAVRSYGYVSQPKTAREYKAQYVQEIVQVVRQRQAGLQAGLIPPDDFLLLGSRRFLEALSEQGVKLYLASGTDHPYVLDEALCLGLESYFAGNIFGALDHSESHDKARLIQRILQENGIPGASLMVIGDGPVEIQVAVAHGALALGVASDEVARQGWNERKIQRLTNAGADLLIPDFSQAQYLMEFLFPNPKTSL